MAKNGLFTKMAIAYTVIITFSFIVLAAFLSFWFKIYYYNQSSNKIISQQESINDIMIQYVETKKISVNEMSDDLRLLGKLLECDIILVDSSGVVFEVSNQKHAVFMRTKLFDQQGQKDRTIKEISKKEKEKFYNEIYDNKVQALEFDLIDTKGGYLGAAIVVTPLSNITGPLTKVYQIIWISAVLVVIFSTIGIYIFSQKIIVYPLSQINYVAKKITKGEVEKRVDIISNDEIGELAVSFNTMADSLEKIDINRRQFISNVSHEIRTPITSIKGFIGGILDGIIPEEKVHYYLSMAYEETKRLTRLVNDLLDLSALESGKFNQVIEEIDINEIIRITVLKLENKINEKALNVDVSFEGEKLMALGDKDRVIQVCTNLLDNAIKYSNESGMIRVTTKVRGKKVNVSFFNTCENEISAKDLKNIWQRFYRADKARTSRESSGLGLSIVRGIISQMGEDIWADKKDDGVMFTFTLKRVKKYLR
ncbi:sensor histidine kinase [Oceanirhabdus sp. W0125-5]|uniref:sensor histidine kinase n=1 Tax=Oceanirhabdus sp. W0125-5 TaxID=2999116 RepID=UPI0022F3422D|nr:HAMP domain-containing sensor histidine kinase [Oceanirhabdus sp. W0125-5]WBW97927.1 HAMP domain-containing sensor histidine kinase [Oceanirhabdus sp. W0125-5]